MRYILLSALLLFSSASFAEPLPKNEEWRFFAVTKCDSLMAFIWITPDNAVIAPAGSIQSKKALDRVRDARDRAAEDGNAYEVEVPSDKCPEI